MSYRLHITRDDFWADAEGHRIRRVEWLAMIDNDPELTRVPENGPYFARWTPPVDDGVPRWLDWFEGNIHSDNPDRLLLGKMLAIAKLLEARVQGDDGETYDQSQLEMPQLALPAAASVDDEGLTRQQRELVWKVVIVVVIISAIVAVNMLGLP